MSEFSDSTLTNHSGTVAAKNLPTRLLIAASGTGGHVFPALAVAEQLPDYMIAWLGVPDRLETQLVGDRYPLHTVAVEGFQKKGLDTIRVLLKLVRSIWQVRALLQQGQFQGVFTTGGYIAAPATIAARSLGLPVILHESNAMPGKVTRLLGPLCSIVALGFAAAAAQLRRSQTVWVGTPVRSQFQHPTQLADLPIPPDVPLVVVVGGSQGAVGLNKLVRQCAPTWLEAGIWIVHLTGDNDPDAQAVAHSHYLALPFYGNMAGLFERADLAISRSGAGTLTELAATGTPAILIPYPFAADDHQTYNAKVFVEAGAAALFQQNSVTAETLQAQVMRLLTGDRAALHAMSVAAKSLAVLDSRDRLAALIRQTLATSPAPSELD